MEREELELTSEQASEALGLHKLTVYRYCRDGVFPRAHLIHGSRRYGYAIPEGDILDYATKQGTTVLRKAREAVERIRDLEAVAS